MVYPRCKGPQRGSKNGAGPWFGEHSSCGYLNASKSEPSLTGFVEKWRIPSTRWTANTPPGQAMNAYPALFVLLGFLNSGNPTDENTPIGKDKRVDETLRQELLRRMGEDQKARQAVLPFLEKLKIWDPAEIKKLDLPEVKKLNEIDRRNTARMKEIVNQHGWPGNALVGTDGANAAWLLVQHADQDAGLQKQCLALM